MIERIKTSKSTALLPLAWIGLWVIPWGKWLAYDGNLPLTVLSDILRLGLALGLFIVPGILLFLLLSPHKDVQFGPCALIPIGFSFATFIIGVTGLAGRFLGLSFATVKFVFAFVGLVEILVLSKDWPGFPKKELQLFEKLRSAKVNIPLLAALLIGTLMLLNDSLFFYDDWTYLAYLTNWQQSTGLDFNEVIYGVNATDAARFWLSLYPMGQALIAELSGVPGILLLGNYLEFFLVPIAIFSLYSLARRLEFTKQAAGFSVLIQITLYCWLVGNENNSIGMWFFQTMSDDKVSAVYILAPVLFIFVLDFLERPVFRNFLLFFLIGIGLTLTHAVILFFVASIVLGVSMVSYLVRRLSWLDLAKIVLAICIWLLPYGAIRFSEHPSIDKVPFNALEAKDASDIHIRIQIREDGLYGISLNVLKFTEVQTGAESSWVYQAFRAVPLMILAAANLIGLVNLRKGALYSYLFVSTALIFIAIIPYTAWLMGYFVSARLLHRVAWFAPLGLGTVVLVNTVLNLITARIFRPEQAATSLYLKIAPRLPIWVFAFLLVFSLGSPTMVEVIRSVPDLADQMKYHRQLGQVGAYLSNRTPESVKVITLNQTDNYLPGISARAKPITFREGTDDYEIKYMFTPEELAERRMDAQTLQSLDPAIPWQIRQALLDKYEIRYILADQQQVESYLEIMNQDFQLLEIVFESDDFVLFGVNQTDW